MKETENGCNELEKMLKLYTTKTTTNMHMFDEKQKLRKYESINDILDHFIGVRKNIYQKRKEHLLEALKYDVCLISNKAKFILEILNETLDLRRKKSNEVAELLKSKDYTIINDDPTYKYLVRMPMDSVTEENVEKLLQEKKNIEETLEKLKGTTIIAMWLEELKELNMHYDVYQKHRNNDGKIKIKKSKKM